MSNISIKERMSQYINTSDYFLLNKVPVIITINGRSFSKLSALLDKPFANDFAQCFYSCLGRLLQEIDGAVFGYSFNDEFIIVARNDQSNDSLPWYDNNIQKIVSVASSIATLQFNNCISALDLNIMTDPIFYANAFTVPNIAEATNCIIAKQQQALQSSIYFACFYELLKKYDKEDIKQMLIDTTIDDKILLLKQECNIDYNDYSSDFKRGVACYRAPKIVEFEGKEVIKNKIVINSDLPIFTKDHSFLTNILKNGSDILR